MTTPADPIELRVSVLSRTGGRERNEDACGYCSVRGLGSYVLADGAGGHGGGDVAARVAIQTVLDAFTAAPEVSAAAAGALIAAANAAVIERQRGGGVLADMRSTLVLLLVDARRRHAFWAHAGDSRLYLLRGGRVVVRTRDQSLLQDMLDAGMLSGGRAGTAPNRAVLTGSLGGTDSFFPVVTPAPQPLQAGDAFLLCSDGFWDWVDDRALESAWRGATQPDEWLHALEAGFADRMRAGSDNYSAIAVWCGDPDPSTRLYPAASASTTSGDR